MSKVPPVAHPPQAPALSEQERTMLLALAEVATPAGEIIPKASDQTIRGVENMLSAYGTGTLEGYGKLLWALELSTLPRTGTRFSKLSTEARREAMHQMLQSNASFWLLRVVSAPLKYALASESETRARILNEHPKTSLSIAREVQRFEQRMVDMQTLDDDEEIEVEAVVVGTGAGGAPVAKALAAQGHAVLILEEGGYFTRQDFQDRPLEMQQKLYRNQGISLAWGNTAIPVPMGKSVGGTTTINSGTCYRTPNHVLRRWQIERGLFELGPGSLDPYFEKVEQMLGVAHADPSQLGGCARVIARGCDVLGYEHGPLQRNAPGCDAQGVCCFGCPTEAKRSTNVSYVPEALRSGAMLYYHAHVHRILTENGKAVGVVATALRPDGKQVHLRVRAKVVVLSCGTIYTPTLLMRQGLAKQSGQLGKNLTIHPASYSWARFDEEIRGWTEIPQGYAIEEFADAGIRFEGAFIPFEMAASAISRMGTSWTNLIQSFPNLACFGFMLAEQSRGRVVLGPGNKPRMTYYLNDADVRKILRAHAILARVYLAAGAKTVFPGLYGYDHFENEADVERFEREAPGKVAAHHLDLSAYHPLGTCRMGSDPSSSVVNQQQEVHDLKNLFIADGSVVNGPLGVNPQITIMALAERASEFIGKRVEDSEHEKVSVAVPASWESDSAHEAMSQESASELVQPSLPSEDIGLSFDETMAGSCTLCTGPQRGQHVRVSFRVHCQAMNFTQQLKDMWEEGGHWLLDGTIEIGNDIHKVPCHGTLHLKPKQQRSTLVYQLVFNDQDGNNYRLFGEKHVRPMSALTGMTTLYTSIVRNDADFAQGILLFDLAQVVPWLKSFRLQRSHTTEKPSLVRLLSEKVFG
jgi:choline dehydrogenase-like flavoprotein